MVRWNCANRHILSVLTTANLTLLVIIESIIKTASPENGEAVIDVDVKLILSIFVQSLLKNEQ